MCPDCSIKTVSETAGHVGARKMAIKTAILMRRTKPRPMISPNFKLFGTDFIRILLIKNNTKNRLQGNLSGLFSTCCC